jgi:hypothetical protein
MRNITNINLLVGAISLIVVFLTSCKEDPLIAPQVFDQNFSIPENAEDGRIIGEFEAVSANPGEVLSFEIIDGNSEEAFSIDKVSGELLIIDASNINSQTKDEYILTIEVKSNLNSGVLSKAKAIIGVWGIPIVEEQSFTVVENSEIGKVVGIFQATSTNPEETLIVEISGGNNDNLFEIEMNGEIIVSNSESLTSDKTEIYELEITVKSNLDPLLVTNSIARITLLLHPRIDGQILDLLENSKNGDEVGVLAPQSLNADENLIYSIISDNLSEAFAINSSNGTITVNKEELMDYEATPQFMNTVEITSDINEDILTTVPVTINLLNVISPTQDQLEGYYPFTNSVVDFSNNNRNGITGGNPTYVEDRYSSSTSALYFDGLDDFVDIGTSEFFNMAENDNFSFSFWMAPEETSYTGERVVLGTYASPSNQRVYKIGLRSSPDQDIILRMYNNGTSTSEFVNYGFTLDWTHVVIVKEGTQVKMYVNGELASTTEISVTMKTGFTSIPTYIGGVYLSNSSPDLLYKGKIDDVAFYSKALSLDEVFILYNE